MSWVCRLTHNRDTTATVANTMAQYGKSAYWDERYTKYVTATFLFGMHSTCVKMTVLHSPTLLVRPTEQNLSYFKTTPTTTLKTTVQTSPHRALLGVGCPSGVVNVSPPLHDFFHRACSIKKPSKLHPDPFSILSFSIYFLFLSFFISTPVPHCQHVHTETPNPLIGTNGIPA